MEREKKRKSEREKENRKGKRKGKRGRESECAPAIIAVGGRGIGHACAVGRDARNEVE